MFPDKSCTSDPRTGLCSMQPWHQGCSSRTTPASSGCQHKDRIQHPSTFHHVLKRFFNTFPCWCPSWCAVETLKYLAALYHDCFCVTNMAHVWVKAAFPGRHSAEMWDAKVCPWYNLIANGTAGIILVYKPSRDQFWSHFNHCNEAVSQFL